MNNRNLGTFKKLLPIWVLITVNVLIFIATTIRPEASSSLELSRSSLSSQPWTFISAMFVHADWSHILFNTVALYLFGMYVLALVGEVRFLLIYFIGGLVGNALFLLLANPTYVVVGSSGAVLALGGVLAVLTPRLKAVIFPIPVPIDLWIVILILALLSFAQMEVVWQANVGGLVTGLVAGYIFRTRARPRLS